MELNKKNMQKIMLIIAFTIVLLVGLLNLSDVIRGVMNLGALLSPFILGGGIAFILNSPLRAIERMLFQKDKERNGSKVARPISLILAIAFVLGIIFIVLFIIVPELKNTGKLLIANIEVFVPKAQKWITDITIKYPDIQEYVGELELDWNQIGQKAATFANDFMGSALNSTFSIIGSIVSGITTFLIGFVFAVYILIQKEKLGRQAKKVLYATLPEKRADRIVAVLALTEKTFSNFLSGQCIEAVILGFMFFVAMTIFRLPYALLVGVLIAFTALIPIFGAFIGCVIGAFLILMIDPILALWFVILFLVLQQIEGNFIYPHVVGGSVGLPSIWVLFAVTVGGNLMGIVGMLIFIPLCSVIYTISRGIIHRQLQLRSVRKEKWDTPVDIEAVAKEEGMVKDEEEVIKRGKETTRHISKQITRQTSNRPSKPIEKIEKIEKISTNKKDQK